MCKALGGTKAASKGQACLRPACWSRGFRRPPPSDFTKGMSIPDVKEVLSKNRLGPLSTNY